MFVELDEDRSLGKDGGGLCMLGWMKTGVYERMVEVFVCWVG